MYVTNELQKWGNSRGARVPQKVLEAANWPAGEVTFRYGVTDGNVITMTPVGVDKKPSYSQQLRDYLQDKPRKRLGEYDWGPDVGREIISD